MTVILLWLLIGPLLGLLIGALVTDRWRRYLLFLSLLLPLAIYTFDLAGYQASEPGFWYWWMAGLLVVGPVLLLAQLLTVGGYLGGAALARSVQW